MGNKNSVSSKTLDDLEYVCKSTSVIIDALKKGCDITQLPNGDIIVTEMRIMNIHYKWDNVRKKMIKLPSNVTDCL